MHRLEALDGLRGYFLVFMMLNHLFFRDGYLLVKVNHQEFGYVQDAQGFVFLSGLLIGMVYTGRMKREGFWAGAKRIWRRAFELYLWAVGCILVVFGLSAVLPRAAEFWGPWLWQLAELDLGFLAASALLLYQPSFMDILPQYIVYLIAAPPLVWLCIQGKWLPVAVGSGLLWLATQLGAHVAPATLVDQAMHAVQGDLPFRAYFNVLSWQVVFMSGVVLGSLTVTGQIDWQRVFDPAETRILWVCVAVLAFFLAYRWGGTFGLLPQVAVDRFRAAEVRETFALLFLVNFVALAYAVAWLMIAGVRSASPAARWLGETLHAVCSMRLLRLLGRHSLQVYACHVVIVYVFRAGEFYLGPFNDIGESLVAVLAVATLTVPAAIRDRHMNRRRGVAADRAAPVPNPAPDPAPAEALAMAERDAATTG